MGAACSIEADILQADTPSDTPSGNVKKKWHMAPLFQGIRGYGRKRYSSIPCKRNIST